MALDPRATLVNHLHGIPFDTKSANSCTKIVNFMLSNDEMATARVLGFGIRIWGNLHAVSGYNF